MAIIAASKSNDKNINSQKEVVNQEKSSRSFFKVIKKVFINLTNAFSHTHIITVVFFVGNLIFIYYSNLQILEIIMICYFAFFLIVFSSFIVIKSRSFEKDVIKIQQTRQKQN